MILELLDSGKCRYFEEGFRLKFEGSAKTSTECMVVDLRMVLQSTISNLTMLRQSTLVNLELAILS
jgi:hypothetical protein